MPTQGAATTTTTTTTTSTTTTTAKRGSGHERICIDLVGSQGEARVYYKDMYHKYSEPVLLDGLSVPSPSKSRPRPPLKAAASSCAGDDELSPLEDFYSLKSADADDEDAKYFYGMFRRTEAHPHPADLPAPKRQRAAAGGSRKWFNARKRKDP